MGTHGHGGARDNAGRKAKIEGATTKPYRIPVGTPKALIDALARYSLELKDQGVNVDDFSFEDIAKAYLESLKR